MTNLLYRGIKKANCWVLPYYVKKRSKTEWTRILMSSKNFNVSLNDNPVLLWPVRGQAVLPFAI